METLIGTITNLDDDIIAENIEIELNELVSGTIKSWSGSFKVSSNINIRMNSYKLVLKDGRMGGFLVTNLKLYGPDISVKFKGSGPLS